MMRRLLVIIGALAVATVSADEGMWRIAQLPLNTIAKRYGVKLTPKDLERLQNAPVRISSGGTGTFASPNGLIVTNHHVALDCIRTSTLAEQQKGKSDNLIEHGFTARTMADELSCRRFRVRIERSSRDVTSDMNAEVKPGMPMVQIQQARQRKRGELERACKQEKGANFTCSVVDFNSGAFSQLIVYEDFNDIRLVYAPEKKLGYFGGDEMNFRFPRYVSDFSILRAYVGKDGSHGEFNEANVPYRPAHYLRVSLDGVKEGDVTFVAGNPGNTNRYRLSESAVYNTSRGMPRQIQELETELTLLRRHAAASPANQVLLQERIFSLANTLKYLKDVLAAVKTNNVAAQQQNRERELLAFMKARPEQQKEYAALLEDHKKLYATTVEANADVDEALDWLQKTSVVNLAATIYEFAQERAKPSDREREPQFQERFWKDLQQALLDEEPLIVELEEDMLAIGFERALKLPADRQIAAVQSLVKRAGTADPRALARAVAGTSKVASADFRKTLIDTPPAGFEQSTDPGVVFARELLPSIRDRRARTRLLNETLFQHRSKFARGLVEWKGATLAPDANFTLRVTYGRVSGYNDRSGKPVAFMTKFSDMFALATARGNSGEFEMPASLLDWRKKVGESTFNQRFANLPVNFVSTNDITGGNSGSATLNRRLEIVGLIFDSNEEAMASDWAFSEGTGRALSTDIRFALTIAREVHGAGWIVDELTRGE